MELYLYGASDVGRKILAALHRTGVSREYYINLKFIDNYAQKTTIDNVPICTFDSLLNNANPDEVAIVLCTSQLSLYREWYKQVENCGFSVYSISKEMGVYKRPYPPSIYFNKDTDEFSSLENIVFMDGCHIGKNVKMGNNIFLDKNCYIGDNVVLCDGAKIGESSVLREGCQIGEDTLIAEDVEICSGVEIGSQSFISPSSQINFNILKGSWYPG